MAAVLLQQGDEFIQITSRDKKRIRKGVIAVANNKQIWVEYPLEGHWKGNVKETYRIHDVIHGVDLLCQVIRDGKLIVDHIAKSK